MTVAYKVYGDRTDGTYLAVDETHAHVNMPAAIMWAKGLDDRPIDATKPWAATAGTHKLRVELDQSVLLSKTIEIRAGAETVLEIPGDRSSEP